MAIRRRELTARIGFVEGEPAEELERAAAKMFAMIGRGEVSGAYLLTSGIEGEADVKVEWVVGDER